MADKSANGADKPQEQGQGKPSAAAESLKKFNMDDMQKLMSGMSSMSSSSAPEQNQHKFWGTQPVPWSAKDDQPTQEQATQAKKAAKAIQEGPIDPNTDPDKIQAEPYPLLAGFEWVTMDMTAKDDIDKVYDLLYFNYVEDDEAMFRFKYSPSFLNWALKSPGWLPEWHVGIRATASKKLVAFISGVPVNLRVRDAVVRACEVNFMCVHKKLRSKRLAPVLIREITRRCNRIGVWQAIYTAGTLVHPPVAVCRYYHRSLDWLKLYEAGFSPLPHNSTKQRQQLKFKLPEKTSLKGLREMKTSDIPAVQALLEKYLAARSQMAQQFDFEEIAHWLLNSDTGSSEKVVWTYVVADDAGKVTDFFSFYELASTIIGNSKHNVIRAAYLFYYGTEAAFGGSQEDLKKRLNELVKDALILAKKEGFDVFNALSLLDNPLFLADQKFGAGDGRLHYYLYNYRTAPMVGGLDEAMNLDASKMGGIGVVML